jgi:hypothetical protein
MKWRIKWNMICKIREQGGDRWCKENTYIMIDDEKKLRQHRMVR